MKLPRRLAGVVALDAEVTNTGQLNHDPEATRSRPLHVQLLCRGLREDQDGMIVDPGAEAGRILEEVLEPAFPSRSL